MRGLQTVGLLLGWVALGLVGLGLPGPGPATAQEEPPLFVERVEVNVVNVEVFVTDGKGRPVRGLGPEDFDLFEDGEPVELTNFLEVVPREAAPPAAAKAPAPSEDDAAEPASEPASAQAPPASGEASAGEPPEERRLHLLVYVDNFNLRTQNRARVLDELDGFLAGRLARGDRVMLVTADRGVRVIQTFTDDPALVERALAAIERTPTTGQIEDSRRNFAARRIVESLADPRTADSAPGFLNSYVAETRTNLVQSVNSLRSATRSLAGVPGRKVLLYVSDGMPKRPGSALADQFFGQQTIIDEDSLFDTVSREANAYQVTFYSFGAGLPGGPGSMSAARADQVAGGVRRSALDATLHFDYQEALVDLSVPTGGAAVLNPSDVEGALEALSRDFDRYYSLGFRPRSPDDGRFHEIEVKARRPGLRLRHRSGFLAKTQEERVADRTISSLLLDQGPNPIGAVLDLGRPEKARGTTYRLPVLVRMPLRGLTLLARGEVAEGKLQIVLAVQDENGGISDPVQEPYPLSLAAAEAEDEDREVGFAKTLVVERGRLQVVVGIWDELSGSQSFLRKEIQVGKPKKARRRSG